MKPLDRALPHEEAARATDAVVRPAQPGRQSRPPDYLRGWTKFSGWDDFAGGDPETLSERRIADYKPFTMVDGEGVRCSLYVSGCLFDCPGC
ncbi:MAG: 4Fe-4S cluster-binding domain-containing protein, partial [Promicromonosporaceae bacterium]|nr:4Fe-4S cluster-binding domain-containing protein [Promicromonosporaceae bacterium]